MNRRKFIAGLGGAVAWPLAARTQQPTVPVIGYLSGSTENANRPFATAFRQGLGEQGYVEGQNVEIQYRWAETRYDRLPGMAADLVARRVTMIAAVAPSASGLAAKSASATLPIVFVAGGLDPVAVGLVASFNRPGGNVTGVSFVTTELIPQRLQILREIVPAASSIGFLVNPTNPSVQAQMSDAETAARVLGLNLVTLKASTPSEIERAFAILVGQRIGALLVNSDVFFFNERAQLAELAARHAIPMITEAREMAEAGGLMSYGARITDAYRIGGTYAGRILKGEKPADLPVQQSTRFEMVLNLKTAKPLGIEVPTATLLRATEVIE